MRLFNKSEETSSIAADAETVAAPSDTWKVIGAATGGAAGALTVIVGWIVYSLFRYPFQ